MTTHSAAARAVVVLKNLGVPIVVAEQTDGSRPIHEFDFPRPLALVLGHEVLGIDDQVLSLADAAVEIPMFGAKHSHNVAVAAGIILAEVRRQWSVTDADPDSG